MQIQNPRRPYLIFWLSLIGVLYQHGDYHVRYLRLNFLTPQLSSHPSEQELSSYQTLSHSFIWYQSLNLFSISTVSVESIRSFQATCLYVMPQFEYSKSTPLCDVPGVVDKENTWWWIFSLIVGRIRKAERRVFVRVRCDCWWIECCKGWESRSWLDFFEMVL